MVALLAHVYPSDDVMTVPSAPTATKIPRAKLTAQRSLVIPDCRTVQADPSLRPVTIVPWPPTATNISLPYAMPARGTSVPEPLTVHFTLSGEVSIMPLPYVIEYRGHGPSSDACARATTEPAKSIETATITISINIFFI